MNTNLQMVILEAAHDGLLTSGEAMTLMNYTYEGSNMDAHNAYKEGMANARALKKRYKIAMKAKEYDEAERCLNEASKTLSELSSQLSSLKGDGSIGSFIFSLFVPTVREFIPFYSYVTDLITGFNMLVDVIHKAIDHKEINAGDFNAYISKLQTYVKGFQRSIESKKRDLKALRAADNRTSASSTTESYEEEVSVDDILAEMTDLV